MNIESWLNEKSLLRNTVLNNEDYYNSLGRAVIKLWSSDKVVDIEENVKSFKGNSSEKYIIILEREKRKISIFSTKSNKNPNIKTLKDSLDNPLESYESSHYFIFSIFEADFNIGISPKVLLKEIDKKHKCEDNENGEANKTALLKDGLKKCLFNCSNYIDKTSNFYKELSIFSGEELYIEPLYEESISEDLGFIQKALKGLSIKLEKVSSVLTSKSQFFHYETFVKDDVLFIQDFDWRYGITLDKDGVNIYSDSNKLSKKKFIEQIKLGALKERPFENMLLKCVNGKAVYADKKGLMNGFVVILSTVAYILEKEGLMDEIIYPENIKSFDYQLRYQNTLCSCSKFEMISAALLRNGGGFDYDEREKGFVYHQTNLYIEDLPEVIDKEEKLLIVSFYKQKRDWILNKEWIDALEYFINALKDKRPLPISCDSGETKEEALDKAIDFCEDLLLFNKI